MELSQERKLTNNFPYPENLIYILYGGALEATRKLNKDQLDRFLYIIAQRPEKQQCIIRMRYQERLTYKQIAEKLNLSHHLSHQRISYLVRKEQRILSHPNSMRFVIGLTN